MLGPCPRQLHRLWDRDRTRSRSIAPHPRTELGLCPKLQHTCRYQRSSGTSDFDVTDSTGSLANPSCTLSRLIFRLASSSLSSKRREPAVADGQSVDPTMGLTPTFGIITPTRTGDRSPSSTETQQQTRSWGRGRDASCLTPPARIRTCRIAACGSYRGWLASKRRLG